MCHGKEDHKNKKVDIHEASAIVMLSPAIGNTWLIGTILYHSGTLYLGSETTYSEVYINI